VYGTDYFRGKRNVKGVFIGTWYKRTDIFDILIGLSVCNSEDNFLFPQAVIDKMEQEYPNSKKHWIKSADQELPAPMTFTQAMTLDANGNFSIGHKSPSNWPTVPISNGGTFTTTITAGAPITGQTTYNQVLDDVMERLKRLEISNKLSDIPDYDK
jgi:hypothetical protein